MSGRRRARATSKKPQSTPLVERASTGAVVAFTDEGLALVRRLAANGQDQATIARALGMAPSTFCKMKDQHESLVEALAVGHAGLADELTHLLLSHARDGNVVAAIFLAKTRLGWRETGDVPNSDAKPNITIVLPDALSPEQYMRTINPAPSLPPPPKKETTR